MKAFDEHETISIMSLFEARDSRGGGVESLPLKITNTTGNFKYFWVIRLIIHSFVLFKIMAKIEICENLRFNLQHGCYESMHNILIL